MQKRGKVDTDPNPEIKIYVLLVDYLNSLSISSEIKLVIISLTIYCET
jgi:hypothetical protein